MLLSKIIENSVTKRPYFFFKESVPIRQNSKFLSVISRKPVNAIRFNKSDFKILYDYPFIKYISAINKSGKTNFVFSAVATPFFYYYYESVIPCLVILGAASVHLLMVTVFSKIFNNIVGRIYVNKEGEVKDVVFSYLDPNGRRTGRIHKASDIINCEYYSKFSARLGFIQISILNSDIQYKVNVRNCKIYDPLIWECLFGKTTFEEVSRKRKSRESEVKKLE